MQAKVYTLLGMFVVAFMLLMLWDIESRMNKRFLRADKRFHRIAKTLGNIQYQLQHNQIDELASGESSEQNYEHADLSRNRIAPYIYPSTFNPQNNTNIFWRYKDPEYIYRKLGKTNVEDLSRVVRSIPENVWQEGAERAARYQVHKYTATIALRLGADRMRELKQRKEPFEGTKKTFDLLNQFGEMSFNRHWDEYRHVIEPILKQIQQKFENKNGIWLRVLLVRLQAGRDVAIHRDNGLWMRISHRIHVPIITDENVLFHASNLPKSFRGDAFKEADIILPVQQPGNIVELNNANIHYVRNSSPRDRVHLICDYIPELPASLTYVEWRCLLGDMDMCEQ